MFDFFVSKPARSTVEPTPGEVEAVNLKETEEPYPLVCTKASDATNDFQYLFMKEACF